MVSSKALKPEDSISNFGSDGERIRRPTTSNYQVVAEQTNASEGISHRQPPSRERSRPKHSRGRESHNVRHYGRQSQPTRVDRQGLPVEYSGSPPSVAPKQNRQSGGHNSKARYSDKQPPLSSHRSPSWLRPTPTGSMYSSEASTSVTESHTTSNSTASSTYTSSSYLSSSTSDAPTIDSRPATRSGQSFPLRHPQRQHSGFQYPEYSVPASIPLTGPTLQGYQTNAPPPLQPYHPPNTASRGQIPAYSDTRYPQPRAAVFQAGASSSTMQPVRQTPPMQQPYARERLPRQAPTPYERCIEHVLGKSASYGSMLRPTRAPSLLLQEVLHDPRRR